MDPARQGTGGPSGHVGAEVDPELPPPEGRRGARRRDDRGATVVEYALLISLFALLAVGAVQAVMHEASTTFGNAMNAVTAPDQDDPPPDTTTTTSTSTTSTTRPCRRRC